MRLGKARAAAGGARTAVQATSDAACAEVMAAGKAVAAAPATIVPMAKKGLRWSTSSRLQTEPKKETTFDFAVDVSFNLQHGVSEFMAGKASVTLDVSGQHTLIWSEKIKVVIDSKEIVIRPGSCNLYHYPQLQFDDLPADLKLPATEEEAAALKQLLLALTTNSALDFLHKEDSAGATP